MTYYAQRHSYTLDVLKYTYGQWGPFILIRNRFDFKFKFSQIWWPDSDFPAHCAFLMRGFELELSPSQVALGRLQSHSVLFLSGFPENSCIDLEANKSFHTFSRGDRQCSKNKRKIAMHHFAFWRRGIKGLKFSKNVKRILKRERDLMVYLMVKSLIKRLSVLSRGSSLH